MGVDAKAQLLTSFASPEVLAKALMPASFQVGDASHFGYEYSFGYFNGSATNIGISQGVLLNTGALTGPMGPQGPNNAPSTGYDFGDFTPPQFLSGQLQNLIDHPMVNASILSFTFSGPDTAISFQYVFASEEYHEFVGTQFVDIFAIFIGRTDSTGIENIAVVPSPSGADTVVTPSTVNNGYSTTCSMGSAPVMNSAYFVDNCEGATIQYDGFTTVLTAGTTIVPNQTYRIWFMISDVADWRNDSGVFIKGNHPNSGVGENTVSESAVYPNPSSGHFVLPNLTGQTRITVIDMAGKTVWQTNITQTGKAEITLDGLPSGIYFLSRQSDMENSVVKIVIEK